MKQTTLFTTALLAAVFGGALFGQALLRPAAQAQTLPNGAAGGGMAGLLDGKLYPSTRKSAEIDATYHLVTLVDSQGKGGTYATKGDTVSLGGETFLVAYDVPLTNSPIHPPHPRPDTEGNLTLINLHAVQAMGGILPINPADKSDDSPAPATPDAGAAAPPAPGATK